MVFRLVISRKVYWLRFHNLAWLLSHHFPHFPEEPKGEARWPLAVGLTGHPKRRGAEKRITNLHPLLRARMRATLPSLPCHRRVRSLLRLKSGVYLTRTTTPRILTRPTTHQGRVRLLLRARLLLILVRCLRRASLAMAPKFWLLRDSSFQQSTTIWVSQRM